MKVLIVGYYGSDNIGDEVLLAQVVRIVRSISPEARIQAISYRGEETRRLHGIQTVGRNKYFKILKAIRESDLVIGGGGSILQNVTSQKSLVYYLAVFYSGILMGKKVVLLGNGFGPVMGGFSNWLTRTVLSGLSHFVARDPDTVNRLKSLGVTCPVTLGADLAYYGYRPREAAESRRVLINLRPWPESRGLVEAVTGLGRYLMDKGYELCFLSMQEGRDDVVLREVMAGLEVEIPFVDNSIGSFIEGQETYFAMVGMRLHALIWAGIKDIPFVSIPYDPKINAYTKMSRQASGGEVESVTQEGLIEAFETLCRDRDPRQRALVAANETIARESEKNREVLRAVIQE
jgi:polysaccharide pyruvyl transferase CsaB